MIPSRIGLILAAGFLLVSAPAGAEESKGLKKATRFEKRLYVPGVEREGTIVPVAIEIPDSSGIGEIVLAVHDPIYEFLPDLPLPFGWQRTSALKTPIRTVVLSTGGRVGGTVSLPVKLRRRKPDFKKEPGGITAQKRRRVVHLGVEEWEARPKELGLLDVEMFMTLKFVDGSEEKHSIDVEVR